MQMPKMIRTPIEQSTDDQVRAYAEMTGVEIEPTDTIDDIRVNVLLSLGGSEEILVMQTPAPVDMTGTPPPFVEGAREVAQVVPGAMQGSLGHDDPKVKIRIANEERNGKIYDRDVEVGVNGRCWQLRRNADIDIPYRVFMAMQMAVTDSVTIDDTPGAGFPEIHTAVQRFNYQIIDMPSRAEIAEWRERTDAVELV